MDETTLSDYKASGSCDNCGSDPVATVRLDGSDQCLMCLYDQLNADFYIFHANKTDCAECGSGLVNETVVCASCGDHSECCRDEDCHDKCNRQCRNCGADSPSRCEYCLLCQQCDNSLDEQVESGQAVLMHEKCFEEVKKDAETLVAAEPTEQYEVSW